MKLPYLRRQYFRRFLRPMNRSAMTPEVAGRSVLFGLLWGITPTVGVQLIGVGLMWLIFDRMLKQRFSLPIAVLLTGITNPLTVVPIYSLYFFTGSWLLATDTSGMDPGALIEAVASLDFNGILHLSNSTLLVPLGIIFVGSIPYVVPGCIVGYRFGYSVAHRLRHRRRKRAKRRSFLRRRVETTRCG